MCSQVSTLGSAEFQLIQATLRVDTARDGAIIAALQSSLDWQRLQHLAHYHGVLPHVYQRLKVVAPDMVPPGPLQTMAAFRKANELRVTLMTRDLIQVVRALEAENILVLCAKGPVLAMLLHGDAALRCFGDLDLLVQQHEYARAAAVLHSLGLRSPDFDADASQSANDGDVAQPRHFIFHFPHHRYFLELHSSLTTCEFPRALEFSELFARRQTLLVSGQPLSTLCNTDIALHVCQHGTQHYWEKFRYLVDFAAVVCNSEATDFAAIVAAAHRQGLLRPLRVGVHLCHTLLGMALPEHPLLPDRLDQRTRRVIKMSRSTIIASSSEAEQLLYITLYQMAIAEKARYQWLSRLLRTMCTPTSSDYHWVALPTYLRWLYPILKPLRRSGKAWTAWKKIQKQLHE